LARRKEIYTILAEVARRVTPTPAERRQVSGMAEELRKRVEELARERGVPAEVRVEGSVAKDTWLRGDADIDVFMLIPEHVERREIASTYMEIARESLRGYPQTERYAEHPYVEAQLTPTVKANIVPCYRVKPPRWKTATDRTPYHTEYVRKKLRSEKGKKEVRLLKRFMKGISVYGSDIKVGGFSGYLAELLIIHYGSFLNTLEASSQWRRGEFLDVEDYFGGRGEEARKLFDSPPLLAVDPVDRHRNVASALREECFHFFREASKRFLHQPSRRFFYPPSPKPLAARRLQEALARRGGYLLFLKLGAVKAVPDVLWGQLYKTEKALVRLLEDFDFQVLRSAVWSDEASNSVLVFELEEGSQGGTVKHLGPPVLAGEEENFLAKHLGGRNTVSGPYIEGGRWAVLVRRKYTDAKTMLRDKLADGGRSVGVASRLAETIREGFNLLASGEISRFYQQHRDFAAFLTRFLDGKPPWL